MSTSVHTSCSYQTRLQEVINKDEKVLIVISTLGGLGDLSAAAHIIRDLISRGGLDARQIVCGCEKREDQTNLRTLFLKESNVQFIDTYGEEGKSISHRVQNLALQIVVPVATPESHLDHYKAPSLILVEYDFEPYRLSSHPEWVVSRSLGLGEESIGLLLEEDLIRDSQTKTPLDEPLRRRIFGEEESNASFYFGYASRDSARQSFIEAITTIKKEKKKDFVFVLPGRWSPKLLLQRETFLQKLQENGIGSITIATETGEEKVVISPEGEGSLRIVEGFFTQQEFLSLMKASSKKVMVTGNASISQAISLNKQWIFEKALHSTNFCEGLWSVAQKELRWLPHPFFSPDNPKMATFRMVEYFQRVNPETMASINRDLYKRDYFPTFVELAVEAIRNFRRSRVKADGEAQSYSHVPLEDFRPTLSLFPLNTPITISLDQVCSMGINRQGKVTADAYKEEFKEATFLAQFIPSKEWAYSITRRS